MLDRDRDHDRVVIVGAGLCGLASAVGLHERGIPCVVLEADDRAGGRLRTIRFPDGAVAEAGMEEFWETSPAFRLLRRFDLPVAEEAALSSVVLDGRLHPYSPVRGSQSYFDDLFPGPDADRFERWNDLAWGALDDLAPSGSSRPHRMQRSAVGAPNFADFVDRLRLPDRLRSWIRVLVETESAVECDRISMLDGLHEMRPFLVPRSPTHAPRSMRIAGGNSRLIDALLARLPPDTVRFGARVRSISVGAPRPEATVSYTTTDGRVRAVRGHHVIVTAPFWALGAMGVDAHLSDGARAALASVRSGSYVKVILRLRPERLRIIERDGDHPFTLLTDGPAGCMYLTDGRSAGRDHVLTMLIHGRAARALNGRSHEHVIRQAVGHLERLEVESGARRARATRCAVVQGLRESISSGVVIDHPRAVAYWPHELGRSRFDTLAEELRTPQGPILIGGDTTESSHSDGAVSSAERLTALVAERLGSRVSA